MQRTEFVCKGSPGDDVSGVAEVLASVFDGYFLKDVVHDVIGGGFGGQRGVGTSHGGLNPPRTKNNGDDVLTLELQ